MKNTFHKYVLQACNSREMFEKYNKVYGEKEKFAPIDPLREKEMTTKVFLRMLEYLQVCIHTCMRE
jgi:hypothetical protein